MSAFELGHEDDDVDVHGNATHLEPPLPLA